MPSCTGSMELRPLVEEWELLPNQDCIVFPADPVGGATVSSQPADSTSSASDAERKENWEEGAADDKNGEPSAAELRRRRLRKLETSPSSPNSPSPPPDN